MSHLIKGGVTSKDGTPASCLSARTGIRLSATLHAATPAMPWQVLQPTRGRHDHMHSAGELRNTLSAAEIGQQIKSFNFAFLVVPAAYHLGILVE